MARALNVHLDELDVQIERISRLVSGAQTIDREMAAGLATSESMASIQASIDRASAAAESLQRDFRKWQADQKR
jgi:plasmid maintenance system antidote protein VapI